MTACNSANCLPLELRKIYEDAQKEYASDGVFFLKEEFITDIERRLSPYPNIFDELISASKEISADGESALYALFVYRVMINRKLFKKHSKLFDFDDEKHPYLAFFVLLPTIEDTYNNLISRDIPESVIKNVLCHYEECVFIYEERTGRRGMNKRYFDWLQHYVDCEILNIDRLRFEFTTVTDPVYLLKNDETGEHILLYSGGKMKSDGMCLGTVPEDEGDGFYAEFFETDSEYIGHRILSNGKCSRHRETFSKNGHTLLISPSDTCLSVHIPPKSKGGFTKEICIENYKKAISIFKKCYPELKIKAIRCRSWMLSQELRDILKADSNILGFQQPYHIYPIVSKGQDVFNFVFKLKFNTYQDMAEDTSLQRAIKKLYLDGKYVYEYGGIFSIDEL